jgi:hypothetical protein
MAKRQPKKQDEDWRKIRQQLHWAGGYTPYRYGTIAIRETHQSVGIKGRIRLPGQKPPPPIFNKDKRKHLIQTLFDAMQDWRYSPFQYEGPTRNQIRSALCLAGYDWNRADQEAAYLVGEVLKGYVRPSYNEGQQSHTASIATCRGCGGGLDDYEITHGIRYCCDECRRIGQLRTTGLNPGFIDLGPTKCENPRCATVFFPRNTFQRFCCRECAVEGRGLVLPMKDCQFCGTPFQPANTSALYCSPKCNQKTKDAVQKAKRDAAREPLAEIECSFCRKPFTPTWPGTRYCNKKCASNASYARNAGAKSAAARLELRCWACGSELKNATTAAMKFCDSRCRGIWRRAQEKAAKNTDPDSPIGKLFDAA